MYQELWCDLKQLCNKRWYCDPNRLYDDGIRVWKEGLSQREILKSYIFEWMLAGLTTLLLVGGPIAIVFIVILLIVR